MRPVWIVLGATSPLARAFAIEAGRAGAALLLVARDGERLAPVAADAAIRTGAGVDTLVADLAEPAGLAALATTCWDRARALGDGPVCLFAAAGTMPGQTEIDAQPELVRRVFAVNAVALAELLQRLAPRLEAQRGGRIVVVGSVAGERGRPSNYVYGASKAALQTYLQGLRARLFPAGVGVTTVVPGFLDTAMTYGLPGTFLVAAPETAAQRIWRAAARGREVVYVPWFWRWIMLAIRLLPEPLFKRLKL